MRLVACSAVLVCLTSATAWSCPTCAAAPVVLEAGPPATALRFASTLAVGGDRLGAGEQALHRTEGRLTLTGLIQPIDRVLLQVSLPMIGRSVRSADDTGREIFSLGDADARIRVSIERAGWVFAGLAGAKFPTAPQAFAAGVPLPSGHQLGTGSFDPLLGVFVATSGENWTVDTTLLGAWPIGGWGTRRPGRSLRWEVGGWHEWGERVSARLALEGRLEEQTRVNGAPDGTSGGLFLFVTPQVFFKVASGLSLTASARWCLMQASWGQFDKGGLYSIGAVFDL